MTEKFSARYHTRIFGLRMSKRDGKARFLQAFRLIYVDPEYQIAVEKAKIRKTQSLFHHVNQAGKGLRKIPAGLWN